MSIIGWPGEIYLIESSSDLTGWIGEDELTNAAGRIEWSEPRGDIGVVQFYRVPVLGGVHVRMLIAVLAKRTSVPGGRGRLRVFQRLWGVCVCLRSRRESHSPS